MTGVLINGMSRALFGYDRNRIGDVRSFTGRGVATIRNDISGTFSLSFGYFSMLSFLFQFSLSGFVSTALLILFITFVALVFHALWHLDSPDR